MSEDGISGIFGHKNQIKTLNIFHISAQNIDCGYLGWVGWEGGGGGGVVNLGVILLRVCEPVFQNLPHSYTWPSKKRTHSYT